MCEAVCGYFRASATRYYAQRLFLFSTHLADAVDDDECGSQDVTAGWVFAHNVFIPQLDWHKGAKELAELLDQQVEIPLVGEINQKIKQIIIVKK